MKKTFFNRYKYKRKLDRVARQVVRKSEFADPSLRSSRDFAWGGGTSNPYKLPHTVKKGKHGMKFLFLAIFCLAWIAFMLLHPFFQIREVTVEGTHRVARTDIEQKVDSLLNQQLFGPLNRKNYLLVPTRDIQRTLVEGYPIQSLILKKSFPHSLYIQVQEKLTVLLYSNAQEHAYLDIDGNIVEKIDAASFYWPEMPVLASSTTSTPDYSSDVDFLALNTATKVFEEKNKEFPVVYDMRNRQKNKIFLAPETIGGVLRWNNFFKENLEIPIRYFVIQNEVGDGLIMTQKGWYVVVNFEKDVERQNRNVETALKNSIKQSEVQYINVRFNDRVYWQ